MMKDFLRALGMNGKNDMKTDVGKEFAKLRFIRIWLRMTGFCLSE